ncbi:glycoside hydrolase family 16 protein [Bacteroides sp.]|uniref:glycoside hydrolase family 16 protein n=1 Tax=Bacteroides sp. TaxID=29523 RepID=UPI0026369A27|nr:glycoside hydrolase family 16 protein [Bacteroides sp.]MDD3039371.1 glycoside hydrolase family 16 protein [Bacteroides sp.]
MKQFNILLFISSLLFCLMLVSCKTTQKLAGWSLVWKENFNQKKSFDAQIWSKIPRGGADWDNYMTDFDSCYAMRKGELVLRGIANHTQINDTAPYLTGGVYTKGKKAFSNGRIEIRAKLDPAKGAWPAIWMLPENAEWPVGGEIDIMERLNHDSIAYQTVHSYYTYTLGIRNLPKSGSKGMIYPNRYNVFAVEMYPDSLLFYINDIHTFTYPRIQTTKKGQFPYNEPFYLLIDMQLGGTWVGAVDPKELPVEMKVDWVRFYQRKSIK